MSLFSLKDVRNHPRRSAFDLSSKVAFSAKSGELLPIKWYFTMPGDKFTLKRQHFTRTQPVNTSAYTRIREYYDWFWVPLHLLWRNAPEVISQMQSNVQHAHTQTSVVTLGQNLPTISLSQITQVLGNLSGKNNYFGFDRADLAYKLIQYLRVGNANSDKSKNFGTSVAQSVTSYSQKYRFDLNVSIFPFLAYKKFCQDYFRYSQWQNSSPYLWNIDYYGGVSQQLFSPLPTSSDAYWKNNTMFDLEYCNWNKDMLMGVLPDTQFGDVASISVGSVGALDAPVGTIEGGKFYSSTVGSQAVTSAGQNAGFGVQFRPSTPAGQPVVANFSGVNSLSFDVLALRRGEALQRWKEISLNVPQNYRAQIKAHFGVDVGENMSGMSTYVGGDSSSLDISEVVNTALATGLDTENPATIAGKGVGSSQGSEKFEARDWGVLMCIYHNVPLLDYVSSAPDPQYFVARNTDLPIPELDSIGMQSVPVSMFTNSDSELDGGFSNPDFTMGYLPRYYSWKTSYDYVLGAFTTTEKEWVAPITPIIWKNMLSSLAGVNPQFTYNFFKVNPSVLDSIFQVNADSKWDTDPFLINCAFDVKVVRNLDYSGMPY
jgi:hypothetical protein